MGLKQKSFKKVKGIKDLLVIITTKEGMKFGGFTPLSYNGLRKYIVDNSLITFIFSLNKRTKFTLKEHENKYAILDHPSLGPVFGVGDISISNDSNQNEKSYSELLCTFDNTSLNIKSDTKEAKVYLAGSYNFKTVEIEVFHVLKA